MRISCPDLLHTLARQGQLKKGQQQPQQQDQQNSRKRAAPEGGLPNAKKPKHAPQQQQVQTKFQFAKIEGLDEGA